MLQPLQPLQPGNYTVIFTNDAMTTVPRVVPQQEPQRRYREFKFPADEFIEAVREHKFLYDHNEPDFKNTAKKEALWEVIGDQFGLSGSKAMSKWRNLRDTYFKIHRQKMVDRRLKVTPQTGRPVKVWALYHKMRQIFGVKQTASSSASAASGATGGEPPSSESVPLDSQGAASSQKEVVTLTWTPTTNGAEVLGPELPLNNVDATLHLDNSPAVSVKQEPTEEMEITISEHEASDASDCENSEHEDETTIASMQHSISVARSLFKLRRKEFKNAVKDFEALQQHPTVIMCSSSLPSEASSIPLSEPGNMCTIAKVTPPAEMVNTNPVRCEAETQTSHQQDQVGSSSGSASDVTKPTPSPSPAPTRLSTPSATVGNADGLDNFGLFVAQRLRMTDAATQARLMSTILNIVLETPSG
ncbi:uncharacterized protein LOC144158906 [Haemaphysalis longicornis]